MYEPPGVARFPAPSLPTTAVRTRGICSSSFPLAPVRFAGRPAGFGSAGSLAAALPRFWASGQTDLQQTNALVWVMIAISAGGAIITFAFLAYSLWKFRDPKVKDRRYG